MVFNSDDRGSRGQGWVTGTMGLAFTAGLTLLGAMAFGYYAGKYLDRLAGTEPWLTLVGFVLGVAAGFRVLIRDLARSGRKPDQDAKGGGKPDRG